MRLNLFHLDQFSVIAGTITVTAIVISHADLVNAKSSEEISHIAHQVTVQINDSSGGGGSGVIIGKQGNTYIVLTVKHVVEATDLTYSVRTYEGKHYRLVDIQRLKSSNDLDIAIVKFDSSKEYPTATLGNSAQVGTGTPMYVYGYPARINGQNYERQPEFSPGFITSREDSRPKGYAMHYTAPTWKGMSGCPVFDADGRVIGIHGEGENVGFVKTDLSDKEPLKTGFNAAIPISTFTAQLSQLGINRSKLTIENSRADSGQIPVNSSSYAQGLARYELGDNQGAIAAYNQVISANPNYAEAYFYRGLARQGLGNPQQAIADYSQAVRINPDLAIAYYNRGLARFEQDDAQGAIEDYTQAIKINPGLAAAYNNRGRLRSNLSDQEGAIADFTQALQIQPNRPNTYYNRGLARFRLMDYKGAMSDYTQAIRLNPNYAKAYGNRGIAYERFGNVQAAILDLHKAAELFRSEGKMADYKRAIDRIQKLQQ